MEPIIEGGGGSLTWDQSVALGVLLLNKVLVYKVDYFNLDLAKK
jgi:hypothetical protein